MKIDYKTIEPEHFVKVSEVFDIHLPVFENYLNCFGAFIQNEIIGVLLLTKGNESAVRIRFFRVLPLFRCNHIGSTLLLMAESYAAFIHSEKITAKYNDAENDIERCTRFFSKKNWSSGKYTHTKFRLKKDPFAQSYISKFSGADNAKLFNEITFVYFNELSKEKKDLIKEQSEKMLSNGLLPFNSLSSMIKDLSVFAFFSDTLIAWSVADSVNYNEVSIRNTFVVNKYRNSGLGMYLWYLIFSKANESHDFDSIKWISFDFQKDDNRLNKLYTLLFGKILEQSIDYFISEKQLI
ncbi:MAG: GNAT family N-acetyltransferase [Dysgonamonadaceae bacterium]|jgi:hypothetical protein|nr:GNAT family N-acetyltransferase [Dysgonamonadaceae bacterium]